MTRARVGRTAAHHQEGHYPLPDGEGDRALNSAMTNREARPHLVKSYKGMLIEPPCSVPLL